MKPIPGTPEHEDVRMKLGLTSPALKAMSEGDYANLTGEEQPFTPGKTGKGEDCKRCVKSGALCSSHK